MLLELFSVFFKLGIFTIGGGIAMLPLLRQTIVEDKGWFDNDEFIDIVSVCQSLPGVVAVNLATFIGFRKRGLLGSVVATFGVILPSFIIILLIARGFASIDDNSYLGGAMAGLRAAALGLVVIAIIQLASKVFDGPWSVLAAITSFALIALFKVNTVYVIIIFIVIGATNAVISGRRIKKADIKKADIKEKDSEPSVEREVK